MKVKFMSLKGPALVWMLMATVASSSLVAQPPKLDGDEPSTTSSSSSSSSSATASTSSATSSSSSSSTSSNSRSNPNILASPLREQVEAVLSAPRLYNDGLVFMHIPKCGGSSISHMFCDRFQVNGENFYIGALPGARVKPTIERSAATGGHISLAGLMGCNIHAQRPIITFLREPLNRAISHLRYWTLCGRENVPGHEVFSFLQERNLNKLSDVQESLQRVPSFICMIDYFAPPGLDTCFETMTDAKVDQCVRYGLEHLAFIGEIEHFEESLHKLNIALDLNIDVKRAITTKDNVTPDNVEKITNPEVLAFLKERTKWETKLWEKLRAAQRWRIAMSMVQDPDMPGFAITQFILPQGFDPDMYLAGNHDLGSIALAKFGSDLWKKREYALRHYVARGKDEGRVFDFSALPKLGNGLIYPKMSFVNNARWPGLIAKVQGLSDTEATHTWSENPNPQESSDVIFEFAGPLPKKFGVLLKVIGAFGPNVGQDFTATVGSSERKFKVIGPEDITIPFINPEASKILSIHIPQPTAPASLTGGIGDPRLLGLAFVGLEVIPSRYPELDSILEFLEGIGTSSTSSK